LKLIKKLAINQKRDKKIYPKIQIFQPFPKLIGWGSDNL
jgi:hypothetical protein